MRRLATVLGAAAMLLAAGYVVAAATSQTGNDVSVHPSSANRLAGEGRIDTAVAISRYQFPEGTEEAYLARADLFADALAGGSLTRGPLLLVPSCGTLPPIVAEEIRRLGPQRVIALGGQAAVCEPILEEANRTAGADETMALPSHESNAVPDALLVGQVSGDREAGCVWLLDDVGNRLDALWPSGWQARFDPLRIYDSQGAEVAREDGLFTSVVGSAPSMSTASPHNAVWATKRGGSAACKLPSNRGASVCVGCRMT